MTDKGRRILVQQKLTEGFDRLTFGECFLKRDPRHSRIAPIVVKFPPSGQSFIQKAVVQFDQLGLFKNIHAKDHGSTVIHLHVLDLDGKIRIELGHDGPGLHDRCKHVILRRHLNVSLVKDKGSIARQRDLHVGPMCEDCL
jgi:hypothetical protein